jgi:hypothetical protein
MYKYDNLQAFDGAPIEVDFDTNGKEVSKALFVINRGAIVKEYLNPTSPIFVDLNEEDTGKLCYNNVANLILYDSQNRKLTCDGELQFTANKEVYRES